jgi:RNA-directed DNA polymerase
MFTTFSPAISRAAATSIRQQIRRMRFHLRSDLSFADIARMINSRAGGWAAYYGRFCPSETVNVLFHIDRYLVRWARRKHKHLRRAPRRAAKILAGIKRDRPGLLAHWRWEIRQRMAATRTG